MTGPGLYGWPVLVASVLSLKGGVGKTTVTLGLASAAVHRGVDTLLVDLDPQMNATTTVDPDLEGASNGHAGGRRWSVRADTLRLSRRFAGDHCADPQSVTG